MWRLAAAALRRQFGDRFAKHRPGPVEENGSPTTGRHDAARGLIQLRQVTGRRALRHNGQRPPVIAAAPDLLEALRKMTDMVEAEVLGPEMVMGALSRRPAPPSPWRG